MEKFHPHCRSSAYGRLQRPAGGAPIADSTRSEGGSGNAHRRTERGTGQTQLGSAMGRYHREIAAAGDALVANGASGEAFLSTLHQAGGGRPPAFWGYFFPGFAGAG